MPVISRGKPAFASSGTASSANDSSYSTYWRSSGALPAWLAYDLSSVPAGHRGQVVVGWYNDPITTPYDHTVTGDVGYNNLGTYTIQVNPAAGGGQPPTNGWVTLATVTNNRYHSRTHLREHDRQQLDPDQRHRIRRLFAKQRRGDEHGRP